MATAAVLPPDLRNRIAAVARRVRRLRFLRGLALLCLVLALGFGTALLADFSLDLPAAVRIAVLAVWGGLGLVAFFAGLVAPMMRRFDDAALAAVVEEKYPELGERLTSSVELADAADDFHGAPELIAGLLNDTAARTRGLNFLPAVSSKSAGRAIGAAVAVLALVLCPAVVWPGEYADLAQRFFRPWVTPPAFAIDAAPAESFAARGRPLTLTARLTPIRRAVKAPDVCTLVQVAADGTETRTPMPPDRRGGYAATVTPGADFRYRVEAGADASPLYPVETVQPVDLAADYPKITARPPAYAEDTVDSEIFNGLVDVTILQHGSLRFECKFSRPAVAAFLDWSETRSEKDGKSVVQAASHPIPLAADRLTGSLTLPAVASGKYALRLVAEHGVETPFPAHDVFVKADEAPQFKPAARKDDYRSVLPYDRIPVEFGATDDVAVAAADVEYRVNRGASALDPVAANGLKTTKADAKTTFSLVDAKAKPGDVIEYRIRVTDNLPAGFGGPHVVYYPADHFLTLRVASEKEIAALLSDIYARLDRIRENLKAEERGVYKTRADSRDRGALTPAQAEQVKGLQKDNKGTEKDLEALATAAEAMPAFQPLADLARDVADKEMRQSGKSLEDAATDHKTPAEREAQFQNSEKQLDSALSRLDQMRKMNEDLARKAETELGLAKLAQREKELAEKAADLAAKDPAKDPSAKNEAEQIKQAQQKTADELQRLTDENPALRQALEEARAEEAADLARRARELAEEQRDLAKARAETEKRRNEERFAELAKKQQELADKANELAKETCDPAQAAKANPLKAEDAQKAADALKEGNPDEALKHQDQQARDLDRTADELAKAIDLAKDPREAARQLARLEDSIKQKAQEEINKQNDPRPLAERMKPLEAEQKAVARATERLSVPPDRKDAQEDKKHAAEYASLGVEAIKQNNGKWIADVTERAKQDLNRLADKLPSPDQRKDQALREVAKLRQQQDEIAKKAEEAAEQSHNADPKDPKVKEQTDRLLTEAARKQADAAQELSKLDAPNQEARQEKTKDAVNSALKDLMDGRKEDVAASQEDARRQLQRLEQALKGEKPADEKAAELARKQKDVAAAAADPKTTPEQKQALKQQQQQIAQEAKNLDAPEAPQRKAEAADAADKAAKAADKDPTAADSQREMQNAAHKLDDLARQLNGKESDAARAQRLADRQAEAAADAKRQADKNPNAPPDAAAQAEEKRIADEARQLHTGDEARAEKERAADALQKAQDAKPQDQARAKREAADALRDLADKMAGRETPAAKANELAKEQHDLAKEAADPDAGKQNADEAKKEADRQAEVAHQLERLDPKHAADARKDAAEKANEAAKALDKANTPADAKDAVARAAEAADKLAGELGKEQTAQAPPDHQAESAKPTDSPRQAAEQMAQQQRRLAQQTQQAQDKQQQTPGEAGKESMRKAVQQVAQKQQELNEKASQLPADRSQKALEQAREAMNQAEQALARNDGEQAKQKQNEAADALHRLADQLPAKAQDTAAKDQPADADAPHGLPTKAQTDQARDLAKQQRDLADQVRHTAVEARAAAAAPKDNPVGDLAKQQQEVAKEAAELAKEAGEHQGKESPAAHQAGQAEQSAHQAAGMMQAGELRQAQQAGKQAAGQMHELSKQLTQTPGDPQAPAEAAKAEQLAQKQDAINRQIDPLADNAAAERAQQEARQKELQNQTGELTQDLNKLAQQAEQGHNGQQAGQAHQAAGSAQQAQGAQQQAEQQAHQGNEPGAQQAQQQAAQNLDQAAQQIAQAAGQHSGQEAGRPTGREVQDAQGAMRQAQGQMNQGQAKGAQASMQQAAQSLAQAAQHAAEGSEPSGKPGDEAGKISDQGRQAGGRPDASLLGPELKQYVGRTWGELPGELRTKIVQQAKVKYGDDYARMIKLYFEQAADTRSRK